MEQDLKLIDPTGEVQDDHLSNGALPKHSTHRSPVRWNGALSFEAEPAIVGLPAQIEDIPLELANIFIAENRAALTERGAVLPQAGDYSL